MKAVGLLSGGLDSLIASKIIVDLGFEVLSLHFCNIFTGNKYYEKLPESYFFKSPPDKFKIRVIDVSEEFIKLIKEPEYGFGKNVNPCIDCKIFFLNEAKKVMENTGAEFVFTGEVVGQRPMSQNMNSLKIIEKKAGLEGKLLRPLSAKLLPPAEPELKGIIEREKLLNLQGRTRKPQFELAEQLGIKNYTTPAGGCLLTDPEFSRRVKDLLDNDSLTVIDLKLLKTGRHFRFGKTKIIVGRNQKENEEIYNSAGDEEYLVKVKDIPGPTSLIKGAAEDKDIFKTAVRITARYSDGKYGEEYQVEIFNKDKSYNEVLSITKEKI